MKTDFSGVWMIAVAALLGGVLGGMAGHELGTRRQIIDDNREAVKVNHARWDADKETGAPIFAWRTCTAPMGEMK